MGKSADPQVIRQLEEEARQSERSGDFLGALDIYEEMLRNGWASARHLTALGFCYIKSRQRQNAREVWLRAVEQEPDFQPGRDALDKYFPGWERPTESKPGVVPHPAAPPPPPPPSFATMDTTLTMETIVPAVATPSLPPPRPAATLPKPAPEARPRTQPERQAVRPAATAKPAPEEQAAPAIAGSETRVNWEFVMSDAAEEAATN